MAALAELSRPALAHGGTYGLFAEILIAAAAGGFFLAIWLRERRSGDRLPAELRGDEADDAHDA